MIMSIIRIRPHHYIHVLNQNTKVARVETGPLNYICQDNERVLFSPKRMTMVPPRHYCVVVNPVARDDNGQVLFDQSGQAKLRHADLEIRLTQDPFPLYPGEEIQQGVTPLQTVKADMALCLKALQDFEDEGGQKRAAGDEWLFKGPGTYIPRKEVKVLELIKVRKEGADPGHILKVTGAVCGIAAGAVGAVVAAPVVLTAVGFTSAGIASGSIAAGMMSSAAIANGGGVAAGSLVAILQSAGAVGLSGAASAAVASAGAAVGGAAGAAVGWLTEVFRRDSKRKPT